MVPPKWREVTFGPLTQSGRALRLRWCRTRDGLERRRSNTSSTALNPRCDGAAPGRCGATWIVWSPGSVSSGLVNGFGQVGCVYTAQGFEYDWSGVILGPGLVWRTDRWVTDRTASKDPVFRKSTTDADIDRLIRNTYKVLLTRGMIGTVVYSTDPETRTKLRELVTGQQAGQIAVGQSRHG